MRTRLTHRRLVAVAAAPLALAATLAAPAVATHAAASATPAAASSRAMAIRGLTAASYKITLITGDTVTLSRVASGRYSVTAEQAPGSSPAVYFTGHGNRAGTSSLYAQPVTASALVASGTLDRGMFDLPWLAAHADAGHLPLVLRFGGHPDSAAMNRDAAALPGATVTGGTRNTVNVSIATGRAAAFWAALTGTRTVRTGRPAIPARLADGITRVWLAGHQVPPVRPLAAGRPAAAGQPADQAGQPLYTVTEDITKANGDPFVGLGCAGGTTNKMTLCVEGSPTLTGLAGDVTGQIIAASSVTCVSEDPCSAFRATFLVPAGVYHAESFGFFYLGGDAWWQNIDLVDPQVIVAGDTHISIDADAASQVKVRTPQAAEQIYTTLGHVRSTPDGQWYSSFLQSAYGAQNDWVTTSSTEPVTVGTFHLLLNLVLQDTPVTMTVTAPRLLAVRATYPDYNDPCRGCQTTSDGTMETGSFTRFSKSGTYGVVDAGYGTPADFAGLNARGKLVLLRIYNDALPLDPCRAQTAQLDRAFQAGAAGVIIDPSDPDQPGYGGVLDETCELPIKPQWWDGTDDKAPPIPYAAISPDDATAIRNQLRGGPVQVSVADSGPAQYRYELNFSPEGRLPASETYQVGDGQLTEVTTNAHAEQRGWHDSWWAAWRPDDFFVGGAEYEAPAPQSVREYYGPDTPDTVWQLADAVTDSSGGDGYPQATFHVFGQHGGSATEDLHEPVPAPGAMAADWAEVTGAQLGRWSGQAAGQICSYCRQGDAFDPVFYQVSGADPQRATGAFAFPYGSTAVHMYDQQGNELPQSSDNSFAAYQLPAGQGRYRLTQDADGISTTWDFTSSAPAANQTPPGFICLDSILGSTEPCRADPLILLRFNPFTDLANAVTAPGAQRLGIDAYYQAPGHPAIMGLKLWISIDGGTTWQPVAVSGKGGSYLAGYTLPPLAGTNGQVSIKAQATDSAGGDVTQVIDNAFAITGAH